MDVWRSGYSAHAPLNAGPEPHDDDLRFNSNLRDLVARDQLVPSARPLPPGWTTSNVTDPQNFCSFRNHVHNYETYVTPTSPAAISFQFPLPPPSRIRNFAAGASALQFMVPVNVAVTVRKYAEMQTALSIVGENQVARAKQRGDPALIDDRATMAKLQARACTLTKSDLIGQCILLDNSLTADDFGPNGSHSLGTATDFDANMYKQRRVPRTC